MKHRLFTVRLFDIRTLVFMFLVFLCSSALAHEVRPAYLELRQASQDAYDVLWKVPARGENLRLSLDVRFPDRCTAAEPTGVFSGGAHTQRWRVHCAGGLNGGTVYVAGLSATLTDVLARVERVDGSTQVARLTPASPGFIVEASPSYGKVASTYVHLGIEHILTGADHLLFVLALIIITMGASGEGRGARGGRPVVSDRWPSSLIARHSSLLVTITAFTLAHSLTLTAATLGFVHVPQKPVEAVIALSIVFVAAEILREKRRAAGNAQTNGRRVAGAQGDEGVTQAGRALDPRPSALSFRRPWIVAFLFGLLHGFGFAGALSEVGLPEKAIPLALFTFNVGVEVGQLCFIAAVLALMRVWSVVNDRWRASIATHPPFAARLLPHAASDRVEWIPPYAIGTVAMFWVIQRMASF